MAYVAVLGGTEAINNSISLLNYQLKNSTVDINDLINGQKYLIDQVMSEASLYSKKHAALALIQGQGSVEETVFLLRSYRSTLTRLHYSKETITTSMFIKRRISAAFKDIKKGQILGATFDYTHRLLKEKIDSTNIPTSDDIDNMHDFPDVVDILRKDGLVNEYEKNSEIDDITKDAIMYPASRSQILQTLTRAMSASVITFAYSSLRGYGSLHPTVGELRIGDVDIVVEIDGNDVCIGSIEVSECQSIIPKNISENNKNIMKFDIGYGLCFGNNETKAIAMSILENTLQESGQNVVNDVEYVLSHIDNVEACGFISHLKLPHYVTFQSKIDSFRKKGDNDGL